MKTRSGKHFSGNDQGDNGQGTSQTDMDTDIGESTEKKVLRKNNKFFYIVFFSLILDLLAFTVILPLLPSLLEHYSQHDEVITILCNFIFYVR